ncbi:6-phospho-3-hexuloisomerase [Cryobacterium sp. TMT2-18-3]|uniref:6-phospho-3-hexuloisomerase n=1 Tax=unclassified Cryobacterium TaxID=2649013 RepID=UPI00106C19EF|nr:MULTISPECIES: 6-phospho-3-hexuloisomerase [unclassified Cryobacterium]TFC29886.1 6-phospho-3-hexuloisomerase [Cryobacterium sp. TMT2-18-2]TFC66081.1 6-phospho-3-hexuloisomerase [Cryobacterium sp. TMT2-18-3]
MPSRTDTPVTVTESLAAIAAENAGIVRQLLTTATTNSTDDTAGLPTLDQAAAVLRGARRVFVLGAGRSGLALRMTAMRLMHLGLDVHVVGEVTTPAIVAGDVLLVASGSGATATVVRAAETAAASGARLIAITTAPASPLAALAAVTVVVPAAQKQDHDELRSLQYSGALFEQTVVVLGDAIFHSLWKASGATADELWPRHANLE